MHKTVAVIGHVDHGKTALVKALTGIETDRLDEERERGLSIVLGFANQHMPEGWLHLIDAPGHSDFIETAAMGISGADAILLVVAANEGPSYQTIEHLKLAQFFGIQNAVVALSKSDLEQDGRYADRLVEINELLSKHEFNAAAIVACSSHTMDGIDLLKKGLRGLLTLSRSRSSPEHAFLPVDRVFSADGSGTVVTGTLLGGDLNAEDPIIIQPAETAGSVRGLQIAGKSVENGAPGARVAVNIRGIKAQGIKKGDVICPPHQGKPSRVFDVAIVPPVIGARPLSHMEEITVLHGTRHSPARVRLLNVSDQGPIIGQLEFKSDQIGFAGQHFVMRRPASAETVCGGQILDAEATVAKRRKDLHTAVLVATTQRDVLEIAKALSERDDGSVDLSQLSRLARKSIASCSALLGAEYVLGENDVAYAVAQFEALKIQIVKSTSAFHLERPTRPQAPAPSANATFNRNPRALLLHAIQGLIDEKTIETRLDGISIAGRDPNEYLSAAQRESYQGAIEQLRRTGLMPELPLDPNSSAPEHADLIELMVWNGDAVRLYNHALNQTIILHSHAILDAIDRLRDAFPAEQTFKTGEAREVLSTNRKTIVPLLEHLDTRGATRRIGNVRFIEEGILE